MKRKDGSIGVRDAEVRKYNIVGERKNQIQKLDTKLANVLQSSEMVPLGVIFSTGRNHLHLSWTKSNL